MSASLDESQPHQPRRFVRPRNTLLIASTLLLIGGVYWLCRDTALLGFISDDGIYAVSALGLSKGLGMVMLQLTTSPEQVRYPWGYPLLLMPLCGLFGLSAKTIGLFAGSSVLWGVFALGLAQHLLGKVFAWPIWSRVLVLLAIAGNFFVLFHFTVVMSEAPYLAFTLASLLCAYYGQRDWQGAFAKNREPAAKHATGWLVAALLLAVCSFYIRNIGISLVAAYVVWLFLQQQWRWAVGYLLTAAATITPWFWWLSCHRPVINADTLPLIAPIIDYLAVSKLETIRNLTVYGECLQVALSEWLLAFVTMMFPVLTEHHRGTYTWAKWVANTPWLHAVVQVVIVLAMAFIVGRLIMLGLAAVRKTKSTPLMGKLSLVTLKHLSPELTVQWLIGLYVLAYSAVCVLWGYPGQSYRFFVVVLPLVWALFMAKWPRTKPKLTAGLLVLALVWLPASFMHCFIMRSKHLLVHDVRLTSIWPDYEACYAYINQHVPAGQLIGTKSEVPLFVNTGHKGFHVFLDSYLPGTPVPKLLHHLEELMDKYQVNYVLLEPNIRNHEMQKVFYNPVVNDLMLAAPKRYRVVFLAPGRSMAVLKRLPYRNVLKSPSTSTPK
jgi:hypothetical protein